MNKLDTYLSLCTEVYELSKPEAPKDSYAFYRDYIIKANGPVLEPMCGTGRFLLPFFEEGFDVQGFDASEHMLKALNEKAHTKNLKPMVWNGFAEDLKKSEKYKLIFIPSGSFCLIIDLVVVKTALKRFYDHLSDDGILLFEVETLKAVPQLNVWGGSVWNKTDGKVIIFSNLVTFDGDVCNSICKYELTQDNSIINTEIEALKVRIHKQSELDKMLIECGFKHVRKVKAFDRNALPDENDEVVVYECKK